MAETTCPICRRPAEVDRVKNPSAPFCSSRCKTVDLGRWLGEGYRIPVDENAPGNGGPGEGGSRDEDGSSEPGGTNVPPTRQG